LADFGHQACKLQPNIPSQTSHSTEAHSGLQVQHSVQAKWRWAGNKDNSKHRRSIHCLQVQQSMQADLAAGEEQEATQTDEVLPHGLVSVITAQNAFTWERPADGGEPQPVTTSMLQVKI